MAKTAKKTVKKAVSEKLVEKQTELKALKKSNTGFIVKLLAVILIGSAVFLLAQKYRGLVIAGTVDTKPVTRWQLNRRLNERYGKTAFDEIVTEVLIEEQAKKNGVTVSDKEITDEIAANEQQFGGKDKLMEVAKQAGINSEAQLKSFFRLKIEIKKLQEKLFTAEVKDEEIKKYYDDNKSYFGDKKFSEVQADIKTQLVSQKVQQQFTEWFSKIKEEAKITSFI